MNILKNKNILLCVTGSIAAYKACEILRLLKKDGANVQVMMSKSAEEFIGVATFAALSNNEVLTNLFPEKPRGGMDHVNLSFEIDAIIVAPATANSISKFAQGTTDDLASTVVLASNKNIYLAPAMNVRMWEHESTKQNLEKLKDFGYKIIGPEIGDMACGEYGQGKMSDPEIISTEINNYFLNLSKNKRFKALVTAGPTNEYIDPVRFITNKSSGKQGYELAKSLSKKGFDTTLISGPTNLSVDKNIKLIEVETADEMLIATQKNLPTNVAVFSAAVADFKVNKKYKNKIKKQDTLNLNLEKNVDILNYVSNHNSMRPDLVIGFAAETNDVENNAEKKLNNKNCDWIIANDVSDASIGFETDFNEVTIFYKNKKFEKISKIKKSILSDKIVERVISELN